MASHENRNVGSIGFSVMRERCLHGEDHLSDLKPGSGAVGMITESVHVESFQKAMVHFGELEFRFTDCLLGLCGVLVLWWVTNGPHSEL